MLTFRCRAREPRCLSALSYILQDQSVAADGPAVLLVHEEGVEVALGLALLLEPCLAAVARAEEDAAAAHGPAVVVVGEAYAEEGHADGRLDGAPRFAA